MKQIRYLILVFLLSLLFLTSCEINQVKYVTVDNLTYNQETMLLTWEGDEKSTGYDVYLNGEYYLTSYKTSLDLSNFTNGNYTIKIQAITNQTGYKNGKAKEIQIVIEIIEDDSFSYSLLMINDTHGAFYEGMYPGINRVNNVIIEKNPDIKVFNGDAFQGSYESNMTRGKILVEAFNEMGFDAFVIGNHEFDWGFDEIRKYKDGDLNNGEANFTFLGCNIIDKETEQLVDFLEPYYIKEIDGHKVGIIGAIGYNQESSILASNVEDYDFVYPYDLIKSYTKELREDKDCDSVILSIHDYDEELNEKLAILSGSYQLDAILCGHTHQEVYQTCTNSKGVTIPIVQNRSQNQTISLLEFSFDEGYTFNVEIFDGWEVSNNDSLSGLYNEYYYLKEEKEEVLISTDYISKSELGSVVTNLMKNYSNADIALINTGGVRAYIPRGNLTIGDIFNSFPFDNEIIEVELSGYLLKSLLNNSGDYFYHTYFDVSQINNNSKYSVAVIDYVFFNPYYDYYFDNLEFVNTHVIIRDLLIDYYRD